MPGVNPSPQLYTLGRGIVSIGEWVGTTPPTPPLTDVGNSPRFEVEVTEERLEHFASRSGTRLKDKTVVLETGYTLNFDLDEISVANMQKFLKASLTGSNVLHANQLLDKEYAIEFASDNPAGENQKWEFWRVQLNPGGAFNVISDEWSLLTFEGDGLADEANNPTSPFFDVTFITTTTTT